MMELPIPHPDVVAVLADGRRVELWMNPLSGDDCEWSVSVDGVWVTTESGPVTVWPHSRHEGEAGARAVLAHLELPVASVEVL